MIPTLPPAARRALLIIGALILSLSDVAVAQDGTSRIRDFDAVLTVRSDGSLDVTEDLTIQLGGASNELVRDLSLRDAGKDSNKLGVEILAVTNEDGQPLTTHESSAGDGWVRRLRISIPSVGSGDRHISIRYRIVNAIHSVKGGNKLGALDEVHWNVIANADLPIDSVRARLVLPAGARPIRTALYSGVENSPVSDATSQKTGNEVSFALARGLAPHQALTISVSWPFGYLHSKPRSSPWNRIAAVISWWPILIPVIVFVIAFRTWDKKGRDPKQDSQVVRYEPVDGVSAAGLGRLITDQQEPQMRLITATLIDLAVRGFVRIEETTPNILVALSKDVSAIAQSVLHGQSGSIDYIIHLVRPRSEWKGLKWHEERVLDGLVNAAPSTAGTTGDSVRVSMLSNKFYVYVPEIAEAIELELVTKGYYRTRPGKVNLRWISYASFALLVGAFVSWFFGGILDLAWVRLTDEAPENESILQSNPKFIFATVLSTLILIGFAFIMPSRTVAGARAREAALGFKEFLARVGTMPSVELLERYLPYAIAFGVENKWTHAFEGIYVKAPSWYSGPMGDFSATTFGHRISDLCISTASSMSSRPSQT